MNAKELNKQEYLKHNIVEDIIAESYVCFIKDNEEYCLRGGNSSYYNENKTILLNAFGSENCEVNPQNIVQTSNNKYGNNIIQVNNNIPKPIQKKDSEQSLTESYISCGDLGIDVNADPEGNVYAKIANTQCTVTSDGDSYCKTNENTK